MIAMALALQPDILIADEPTTALDVTIQAQILTLLGQLQADLGLSLLLITHDLGIIAEMAERVAVMYAGRIIEEGPTAEVISNPRHPYTRGLIDSVPQGKRHGAMLTQIKGMTPSLLNLPEGCKFAPRCPRADAACQVAPSLDPAGADRSLRCHHPYADADQRLTS